ncbi:Tripeptidyl-peptidase I [Ascochyta rabiei]|uniref:Tripeptidyl-peptidase I n=1 Tax=Didymella rabiei TaxID=5454 RepID=UPI00220D0B29|nr:Tripeptidyl-peptidase I [Ascochyta rabiei]UPX18779.1 Tripeptidyl-peptidase I [Ascochyta rabiei]
MKIHSRKSWYLLLLFFFFFFIRAGHVSATTSRILKGGVKPLSQWELVGRAPPYEVLEISIGLKQHRFEELEKLLGQASDPSHSDYGQWLSSERIQTLVKPVDGSHETLFSWLSTCTVVKTSAIDISAAGDWIYVSIPVYSLERLLQAKYYVYKHAEHGDTVIRTLEWSLPQDIADVVDVIEPTTSFMRPQAQLFYRAPETPWEDEDRMPTYQELVEEDILERGKMEIPAAADLPANPSVMQACNRVAIAPLCLRVLYGTNDYHVHNDKKAGVGIVNFIGESANRSDVRLFLEKYHPDAAAGGADEAFNVTLIAGAEDQQSPNTPEQMKAHKGYEGALDAQTVLGISWPLPLSLYNVGGKPPFKIVGNHTKNSNEPYLTWLRYMKTLDRVPSVISISYAEDEKSVPVDYARRVCAEFAQLGARGVTVLVASGDYGVGRQDQCGNEDGQGQKFAPSFPASCPYVTAVGATRFLEPEIVAFDARNNFSSGGGFSNIFARPAYQRDAVEAYLDQLGDTYAGFYNPNGRAFPDLSAMGYHYAVIYNGTARLQDGTSASTPTVASIIALVNDALEAEGRPPLGFLNPWLYAVGHRAFTDVTWGSNLGCNSSGFPALKGWDPTTGFGTPWFPALKALAMKARFRLGTPWYYLENI